MTHGIDSRKRGYLCFRGFNVLSMESVHLRSGGRKGQPRRLNKRPVLFCIRGTAGRGSTALTGHPFVIVALGRAGYPEVHFLLANIGSDCSKRPRWASRLRWLYVLARWDVVAAVDPGWVPKAPSCTRLNVEKWKMKR